MNDHLLNIFSKVETTHWWFEGRRFLLKKEIKKRFKSNNLAILDIGCGTGSNFEFLSQFGRVSGVDNSAVAINHAKKFKFKTLKRANAEKLPFADNTFDLVLLLDVIEHIKDDKKALSEAKRVVKKNGLILVTVPAMQLIWSKHDQMQGHFRRYSKNVFYKLVKDLQLRIIDVKYFNFFLSLPISTIRIMSRLELFNKVSSYDSKINFGVVNYPLLNNFLTLLFKFEILLMKYFSYPFGISLVVAIKKN